MGSHKTMGTLQEIDTDILTLSVVCLTGGHDVANVPLLTFPASAHPHLEFWSCERLGQLLRHYVTWMSVTSHARSVACLADLRNASKDVISVIVESVEKLEISSRGTVSSVYFLKPVNKARSRLLKKMLGLKPSKKMPKIPLFKVVLMKTHQELFNQIDLCQLTSEFGGTLTYDHAAWMKFYEVVAPCLREAENLKKRVPDLKDRVELLQDYDIHGHSVAGIQQLLNDLTQSFQHSLSEAAFQVTLDHLKQALLTLDSSQAVSSAEASSALRRVHTEHVQQATERVRELYTQLEGERNHLEDTWRTIEDGLTVHLQIQRHRERAAEIEKRMKTHYEPLLLEHPSVGSTLSQAELYRTHFTTTLYEPSKELLSQATEILEDVQRLRERMSHVSPRCDVTDILARLTVALQPFTHRLQSLQDVYVSVHIFHLLFQKALTWYRKVLKFLPEGLESRAEAEGDEDVQDETSLMTASSLSSSGPNKILQMPMEWQVAVQSFLHKHPPPREQHLARLDTEIPPQVDKGLRVQARSLALRLRLLQRLLYSRRVSAKLLGTVFKWRAEVLSSSSSTSSTPQPKSPKHLNHRGEDSSLVSRQDAGQPPPKPARLFTAMRCVNSFSSSEGGDTDSAHVRLFPDPTGVDPVHSFARHEIDALETLPSNHPLGTPEIVQKYQKPPKLDIKIISPFAARESDSDKSDPQQSRTSDEVVSGSDLILAGAQENPGDERFIRLTFTPPAASSLHRHSYAEDSLDSEDLAFRYPDTQTGSESGIDVLETEDPWDSIIDRIKAVSNSNLPSDVKIQCMSHLLSQSTGADSSPRPSEASTYPGVTSLQPQSRGEDLLERDVAGFNQFRQHIGLPQDTDVRRHQSFAIAREDVMPPLRRRQDSVVSSLSQSELCAKAGKPDRRGCSSAGSEHFDPLHHKVLEKPANTVARMRHRLARSLMDLDEIDQHSGPEDVYRTVRFKTPRPDRRHKQTESLHRAQVYSSGAEFPAVGRAPKQVSFSHASRLPLPPPRHPQSNNIPHPQDRPRTTRAMDSLTRSYEGGLDTVHLSQPRTSPNKLVAWRSHEDGLDSLERPSFLPEKPPDKSASSETAESGSDSGKRHVAVQHVQRPSPTTRKNPSRWRQGIVEDYLASPTVRERRKSKEFIAPSFLKPFHSMHNLHLVDTAEFSAAATATAAPLTLLPEVPRGEEPVASRVRGHYVGGGQRDSESDSLSEGSRLGGRKSSLEMLSDEVDQEYLSQDEVHSSLQRSQRILMETEDALRLRTKQQRDATRPQCDPKEADDTRPLSAPVYAQVPDHVHDYTAIQRHHWNSEQHEMQVPAPYIKPVQIRISAVEDTNGLDLGTDASASPDQDCVTSNGMMAEGEFDADVSNLSDSNLDSDKRQESV